MSLLVVGVADCRIAKSPGEVLVTYALGSCIGVAAFDPHSGIGGLLHFMLPDSSIDPERGRGNPYKFADTGIPRMLADMALEGANCRRLVVRIAGGAQIMNPCGVFDIGRRNHQALRRLLWKAGLLIHGEAIGGDCSRSVRMEAGSGRLWLRLGSGLEQEMPSAGLLVKGDRQWLTVS